jgi:hypothetical protein
MSFDYFDKVYCIHLPNPERREKIEREFKHVGITDVQYIHADRPDAGFTMSNMRRNPRGEFGCSLSHIRAACLAISDGAKRPLFIEDDVVFHAGAVERMRSVRRDLDLLPYWDILYMGGHPRGPCHSVTDNLVAIDRFSFAEAYAMNGTTVEVWVDFWLTRVGKKNAMVDIILGEFASSVFGYCVYPLMTHQPPGFSQITGQHDSKDNCITSGWKNNLCTTDRPCKECRDWLIKSA